MPDDFPRGTYAHVCSVTITFADRFGYFTAEGRGATTADAREHAYTQADAHFHGSWHVVAVSTPASILRDLQRTAP